MNINIRNYSDTSPPCGTFLFGKTNSHPKRKEPHSLTMFIKNNNFKKNKMKKILTLIFLTITFIKGFSQEIPIDIIERINKVDYIFEGSVIDKKAYYTIDMQKIYTINLVKISKVLKGELECGTVELITTGGEVGDTRVFSEHLLEVDRDAKGVFLCKLTDKELPQTPLFSTSNAVTLDGVYENQSFIKYTEEDNKIIAHDITGKYDSLIQFYNLAQIITGFNFKTCDENAILKIPILYQHDTAQYLPTNFTTNIKEQYDANIEWIKTQKKLYTKKKKKRVVNTINFQMSNPITTGTNPKYCEFDIVVSDNIWTKYLDIAYLRIEYPDIVFGTDIVANNKITVTRGSLINNTNCYSNPVPTDIGTNSIYIPITESVYSQCKSQITNVFQQLIHVKIEMQNCVPLEDIKLEDSIAFGGLSTFMTGSAFSDFPNDTFSVEYDTFAVNTVYTGSCNAEIVDFWPKKLHGGTHDTMWIEGYQFRDYMGTGGLYFHNANAPSTGMVYKLKPVDIISWTDTLIKVIIPSIDSNQSNKILGSGYFKIINNLGQTDTSPTKLEVVYSLRHRVDSALGTKNNVLHYNANNNGGYSFYVDTSVSNNPKAYAAIKKAMREWVCATGINFNIIGDTTGLPKHKQTEGINHITFGPLPQYAGAVIVTDNGGCLGSSPNQHLFTDIDFIISDSVVNWYYDTLGNKPSGKVDFYQMALHELGHAIGHKHIIDSTQLMYYLAPFTINSNVPFNLRNVDLLNQVEAVKGGRRQVGMSSYAPNFWACSSSIEMSALAICDKYSTLSTSNVIKNNEQLTIYPNPFTTSINIKKENTSIKIENIKLFNLTGSVIKTWDNIENASLEISIQLPNIPANTIYLLQINTNNGMTNKLITHD
jgi:hypothetical protein